jgi:hypothetical protein
MHPAKSDRLCALLNNEENYCCSKEGKKIGKKPSINRSVVFYFYFYLSHGEGHMHPATSDRLCATLHTCSPAS